MDPKLSNGSSFPAVALSGRFLSSLEPAIAQDAVGGVESYVLGRRSFADGSGIPD